MIPGANDCSITETVKPKFNVGDIIYDPNDGEVLQILELRSSAQGSKTIIYGKVLVKSNHIGRVESYTGETTEYAQAAVDAGFILHGSSIIDRVLNKYD